ncbi:MAG: hypothetical protein KC586_00525, partial [Myxococcales bacterium]|nr:hypothetical protein [Myxococcales bacterium]
MHARHPLLAFFAGLAPVLAAMVLWRPEAQPLPAEVEVRLHDAPRWVALVGGAEPASTQVSLAQDAELIRRSLGDEGTLLFGGGTGTLVQVRDEDATPRADLRARLADLFDPRDRAVRYVPGPEVDGPA